MLKKEYNNLYNIEYPIDLWKLPVYDSEDTQKLEFLKVEIWKSLRKLDQLKLELSDLIQKCESCLTSTKQALNIAEQQKALLQESPQDATRNSAKVDQDTILIVEDELLTRELLKDYISSHGRKVITAEDGHEAILAVEKQKFSLVFLDLKLPRVSGVEVLKKIREIHPDTPVVVITGDMGELQSVQNRNLRPQWVIPKPFKLQQINEALSLI